MFNNANLPGNSPTRFTGDVQESLNKLLTLISKNSGVRQFDIMEINSTDMQAPFNHTKATMYHMTSPDHDFTQLEDSFILLRGVLRLRSDKGFTTIPGIDCQRIFIGLKNSNELFRQPKINHNNIDTEYSSIDSIAESHLYSTNKPRSEKLIHKHAHSLWENVSIYDDSVCGTYFDPTKLFPTPRVAEIPITFIVSFLDFVALQVFPDWHRSWKPLAMKTNFSVDAFVTAQIEPHSVATIEYQINNSSSNINLNKILNTGFQYNKKFNQASIPGEFLTKILTNTADILTYTTEQVLFTVEELIFNSSHSILFGYNVDDETNRDAMTKFPINNPLIIPAQALEIIHMPGITNTTKYDGAKSITLNNVTDITPVFLKDSREITCFENPMIHNFNIFVNQKQIPNFQLCTQGPLFFEIVRKGADLDGLYEMTQEFEESLTIPLNNPDGTPIRRMKADQTNFLPTIPVERKTEGFCFDGIETGNTPVTVRMKFDALYPGDNDVYLNQAQAAPQLWLTRDTFWSFDMTNGLKYHHRGTPLQYASVIDSQINAITGNPRIS